MQPTHRLHMVVAATLALLCPAASAAELEWIEVSADGKGFVRALSQRAFTPWGFNYDHEGDGRLIEDYWDDDWDSVASAFAEMKALGANVARIHLQFGKWMDGPDEPNQEQLDRLARLLEFAQANELYLDLTGLGCYHKADVPAWYDSLDEPSRWQAQAVFWEAIARTCAGHPAVFCYDLMNEPVVPGGRARRDDWLGPAFAGKHFVQFIALEQGDRERPDIARRWIDSLVKAIRKHDRRHLITVGMVPWSLDRQGLTSGFVPDQVAGQLDFISVHLYPETGKVDEAIETLAAFAAVGKPVVIEELFPLKCGVHELSEFIDRSQQHACGWIGFYWGTTPDEYRSRRNTLQEAITLQWLELFQQKTAAMKK